MKSYDVFPETYSKEKVLVITGCCKTKYTTDPTYMLPACKLYQGQVFKFVQSLCRLYHYDYVIISAEYGLVTPDKMIGGYEKVLKRKSDVDAISPQIEKELSTILPSYNRIIVVAGKMYRDTLKNIEDDRFGYLKSKGIGDLQKKLKDKICNR